MTNLKRNLAIFLLAFLSVSAWGQVNYALMPMPKLQFFDPNGAPLAGGKVHTYSAGTTSPLATYTDSTGLAQNTNPIILDASGSASIWLGPSLYRIELDDANDVLIWSQDNVSSNNLPFTTTSLFAEGSGCTGVALVDVLCGDIGAHRLAMNNNAGGEDFIVGQNTTDDLKNKTLESAVLHQPIIDTGTFTGDFSIVAAFAAATSQNNVLHVGGSITSWTGSDIGAQTNAAYAALPASGGEIDLDPKADGSCYDYSTPIVFATVNKLVYHRSTGGACLNYTPTSGSAITVDYVGIGSLPNSKHGFENLHLINNSCDTSQGCGGSAIGINVGNTNQGQLNASMISDTIQGFAVGYQNTNALSVQIQWYAPVIKSGGIGMILGPLTGFELNGGTIGGNNQAIQFAPNGNIEMSIFGTQFFSNIGDPAGILDATQVVGSPAAVDCHDCHFEMQPSASEHMVKGNIDIHFFGGLIVDDNLSAGTGDWFFNLSGNSFDMFGTEVLCGRTTMTQAFLLNATTRSNINVYMGNDRCSAVVGGANATRATVFPYSSSASGPQNWQIESPLALTENGVTPTPAALQDILYGGNLHQLLLSLNGAAFLPVVQTITTSFTTTAATTDVVTVTGMTASGHCSLTPTNSGAAGGIASVFISAKAANQITVSHTATASWTFDVICTPQ